MKKTILILLVGISLLSCVSDKQKLADQLTMSTLWFQQSAEMRQSYYQSYRYAELLLDKKIENKKSEKPGAVVLDIDETVLDNSPYQALLIDSSWTYTGETWKRWTDQARAQRLPGALEFVNYAKENGVEVFYISNRKTDELQSTIKNLKEMGFPNASEDYVALKETTSDKTERRNAVLKDYDILVYVGDNLTDYSEIFANRNKGMGKDLVDKYKNELLENFVMLPNPMYGEWEGAIYNNDYSVADSTKLKMRKEKLIR